MKRSQSYVLVLDQDSENLQVLGFLLNQLRCPMVMTRSIDQAMARASQISPYLIILSGRQQSWSKSWIKKLRNVANHSNYITIVALTDFYSANWLSQEENPDLDGILVNPLNSDVLVSLVQSAWMRQAYCNNEKPVFS